jgi:PKD repeat protein
MNQRQTTLERPKANKKRSPVRVAQCAVRGALLLLLLTSLFPAAAPAPAHAAAFTVTTTADSGPGSLRQAILDANANPGADTITFAIGATGSQQTLQPTSALPIITAPVTLDAWSQGGSGYTGPPLIELHGALAGSSAKGLSITGGSSVVRGLVINGFLGGLASGIYLHSGGDNWIYGNYIGTNVAGDTRSANQRGIWIEGGSSNNRIGTNADGINDAAERNVISANVEQNIWIYQPATTGNLIMGNTIGLNAAGTAAVGVNNQTVAATGILVQEAGHTIIGTDGDGMGDALEGNVIGGNIHNINLTGTSLTMSHHTRISGNRIGTNAAGTTSVGLQAEGVRAYITEQNTIGTDGDGISDELEGNLISGHGDWGVLVQQTGALHNVIAGNKIGTDITGMSAIPNGYLGSPRGGIYLGGYGNLVGSNFDGVSDNLERNLIAGNSGLARGIFLHFVDQPGAVPNAIAGNWIGVDATGQAALPNGYGLTNSSGFLVGLLIKNNVISGHTYEGISLSLTNATVIGNLIGVAADGVTPLGNGNHGIRFVGSDNMIGGTGAGAGNVIAHNGGPVSNHSGIALNNGVTNLRNTFRGNRIYANARLGIDLAINGVTPNDQDDLDSGSNNLQNFPTIAFAQAYANGTTQIQGTLNSNPNTTFTLDFYYSATADPTGYGEGEYYLGAASVTTDGDGDAPFDVTLPVTTPPNQFVTATATHADGSTSEFSLAYAASGVADVPITGLTLQFTPPVYENVPVQLVAGVSAGTGVSYAWDFGDGGLDSGAVVEHTFTTPGTYTVTVAAENNSSSVITSTLVSVLEPANINGFRWMDFDGDGFFGLGETVNAGSQAVVFATLQEPPFTVLGAVTQNGSYQIFTPQAGVYQVEASHPVLCPIITNCVTSPNPVIVGMGEDGGVEINFGFAPVLFVPQPDDDGYLMGRAWLDSNGNGRPDHSETPLNGHTVRLLDSNGNQLATHVTGSSWGHGGYAFRISEPGLYRVQMDAPSGVFPASRETEAYVADLRAVSAQLPFLPGGVIGGQVSDVNGVGIGGINLTLQPGNLQALTASDGSYSFSGLSDGNYTLHLTLPLFSPYLTEDGITQRFVPATINGSAVENWTLLRKGELLIRVNQVVNGQPLPMHFIPFEIRQNNQLIRSVVTDTQGEARVVGLAEGVYTIQPQSEIVQLIAGLTLTPAERTAVVTNGSAATLNFTGSLARTINMFCLRAGVVGQGFACNFEVFSLDGAPMVGGYLPASQPATSYWLFSADSVEVRLIPDPDVPGQETWPTYSQIVVAHEFSPVEVRYPWNPANPQTIAGYVFWDRCAPEGVRANSSYCTETNVPSNNGIPVTLYNQLGVEVASTLTTQGASWNTGYFSFPNLPVPGDYRVRVNLPAGYLPKTAVERWYALTGAAPAPEMLEVGYDLNENQSLGGRVFWDTDANGVYDEAWDDPIAGAAVAITRPDGSPVAALTTGSNGGFTQSPITSGDYRVTLTLSGQTWTREVSAPLNGGVPLIDFAVAPMDNRPRVLVFVDGNHNGVADAGEQRLPAISVQLRDAACQGNGAVLQTVDSDSGGVAVFNHPPTGYFPVCAQISAGLPAHVLPASPAGVNVPRSGGAPVALAVQPANTLLVRTFLDDNGNGSREAGEVYLSGGSATINGVMKSIGSSAATFYLPSGAHPVAFTPPAGYASLWSLPIGPVVMTNATQTLLIPLRDAGSISGKIWPPNQGSFSLGGGSMVAGLTVRLQNIATNATLETTSDVAGNFNFGNLTPATYRLRIPAPPPGYVADSEPLITYQSGQTLSGNNLMLAPTGHIVGVVFNDSNGNQQWDNNEPGVGDFVVRLMGAAGQEIALATPDASGHFRFEGLNANTPYTLRLASPDAVFITTSPGVFTVGAALMTVQLGVSVEAPSASGNQYLGGVVRYQQDDALIPVAGARIIHYAPVGGSCQIANPIVLYDQYTGLEGHYGDQGAGGCFKVVDVPGFNNSAGYSWGHCSGTGANCYLINGGYGITIDITLSPTTPPLQARGNGSAQAVWSAFRDDNGNGARDAGEPGLAGATLAGGGVSGVSGPTGWGQPLSLADGRHALTVAPPAGYVVNGPDTRTVSIQGANATLPAIPLRPAGLTIVQAFVDLDGDGEQDAGEAGVGGVGVTLGGLMPANGVTTPNGRVPFAGLPNGNYTVNATPPAGFAAVPGRPVTLAQGGVIQLPLQLAGQVSGVAYLDWDGDGRQQPDEPRVGLPLTLTLSSGVGTQWAEGMGGLGLFLGTPPGSYTLAATTPAVQGQAITLATAAGLGAALAAVAPGQVRGAAWLDVNRDGLRQPWETPLAGIPVTLASASAVTDADGRFIFQGIAPGIYTLSAVLPTGLTATLGPATVSSQRGAVVGIPASVCLDFNASGRTDVQDIMQVGARWNNPAVYDPLYDVAPPFGSPIDILDISAIAGQWDTACQPTGRD